MRRLLLLVPLLGTACVSVGPDVSVDSYRGVVATHFDGIPDRSAVCAVLTNRGARPVHWVRLRLRSYPETEARRRWISKWLYEGTIRPGETRAVRLVAPPVAGAIELQTLDSGRGRPDLRGRPVEDLRSCSERELRAGLARERTGRTAPGLASYPIVRRGSPAEPLVASERPPSEGE